MQLVRGNMRGVSVGEKLGARFAILEEKMVVEVAGLVKSEGPEMESDPSPA